MSILSLQGLHEEPAPEGARARSSSISLICCLLS